MAKAKDLLGQIAQGATKDQVTVTITSGKDKLLLRLEGKLNVKGKYAYVSLPPVQGLYAKGDVNGAGNLTRATPGADAEAAFFPERAAELAKKAEEVAQLKELAKKLGFKLVTDGDSDTPMPFRTRAPRGSKPKIVRKAPPAKGDKFVSNQNGIVYTIDGVDGKKLKMKGEDGSKKEVTYSGIFWRWHSKV